MLSGVGDAVCRMAQQPVKDWVLRVLHGECRAGGSGYPCRPPIPSLQHSAEAIRFSRKRRKNPLNIVDEGAKVVTLPLTISVSVTVGQRS